MLTELLKRFAPDNRQATPTEVLPFQPIYTFAYRADQIDPSILYHILGSPASGKRLTLLYRVATTPGEYSFTGHHVQVVGHTFLWEDIAADQAEKLWPQPATADSHRWRE